LRFELSQDLVIDSEDARVQQQGLRIAIIGHSGAGKSWTIALIAEQALDQGLPVVIIDPHGEYWTLSEAYPQVLIVGGENADLPLAEEAAEVYAQVYKGGSSLVFNLKDFFIDEEAYGRLVEKILRSLWKAQVEEPRPTLWVLEEAQLEVPQEKGPDVMRRVGLVKGIATGGRKFGVNLILGTQRPAELHKTPLSQCWLRLFGGLAERLDRDAVRDYLKPVSADELKALPTGSFYVFGWGEPFLTRIRGDRRTRHGAETPQMAILQRPEAQRASIGEFRQMVEESLKKVQEEKTEVARLTAELRKKEQQLKDATEKANIADVLRTAIGQAASQEVPVDPDLVKRLEEFEDREREAETLRQELAGVDERLRGVEAERDRLEAVAQGVQLLRQGLEQLGLGGGATLDEEALVARVVARLPAASGVGEGPPPVAPVEALRKGFLEEAKQSILSRLGSLSPTSLRALAYIETYRGRVTWTDLGRRALGRAPSGQEIQALRQDLDSLVRQDPQGRVYPNLEGTISQALQPYGASKEEINLLSNHILAEVINKVPFGIKVDAISRPGGRGKKSAVRRRP